LLSGDHQVVQRLQAGVGGAEDEGVVAVVDGGGDEGCGFGVGTGDSQEVGAWFVLVLVCNVQYIRWLTHDIGLGTNGN
jgi:hypothetical protein